MKLYGEELFRVGIILIIAAVAVAAIFISIHLIMSSNLKKQLEREYGKNK